MTLCVAGGLVLHEEKNQKKTGGHDPVTEDSLG